MRFASQIIEAGHGAKVRFVPVSALDPNSDVLITTTGPSDLFRTEPEFRSEVVLRHDRLAEYISALADAGGLFVEVGAPRESWRRRLNRERHTAIVKRLHRQPGEHDLYVTGDEGLPAGITDGNGEVVLACCRDCGLAECELDETPLCPGSVER